MSIVTVQRSPNASPCKAEDDHLDESPASSYSDPGVIPKCAIPPVCEPLPTAAARNIQQDISQDCFVLSPSETYFAIKGAAMIIGSNECDRNMKRRHSSPSPSSAAAPTGSPTSKLNLDTHPTSHGIKRHLQAMLYFLRKEDTLKMAVKLESQQKNNVRYLAVVSTLAPCGHEESCIIGFDFKRMEYSSADCDSRNKSKRSSLGKLKMKDMFSFGRNTPDNSAAANARSKNSVHKDGELSATIGLVLPIYSTSKISLDGDGGFRITHKEFYHLLKPVSIQAMWSALQTIVKCGERARMNKELSSKHSTHKWVDRYRQLIGSDSVSIKEWHVQEDSEVRQRPMSPHLYRHRTDTLRDKTEAMIEAKLREIMYSIDLEEATSKMIRNLLEEALEMSLSDRKSFIDREIMMIMGQMDAASNIIDGIYLGTEWNASDEAELKDKNIGYVLNVTTEIDNFFPASFIYKNIRVHDCGEEKMLQHWEDSIRFLTQAVARNKGVLVHCRMGVSRSASVVIAYIMKQKQWDLETAYRYVKEKRPCIRPNDGFMKQLNEYQGIITANRNRNSDLWRAPCASQATNSARNKEISSLLRVKRNCTMPTLSVQQRKSLFATFPTRVRPFSEHCQRSSILPDEEMQGTDGELDKIGIILEPEADEYASSFDTKKLTNNEKFLFEAAGVSLSRIQFTAPLRQNSLSCNNLNEQCYGKTNTDSWKASSLDDLLEDAASRPFPDLSANTKSEHNLPACRSRNRANTLKANSLDIPEPPKRSSSKNRVLQLHQAVPASSSPPCATDPVQLFQQQQKSVTVKSLVQNFEKPPGAAQGDVQALTFVVNELAKDFEIEKAKAFFLKSDTEKDAVESNFDVSSQVVEPRRLSHSTSSPGLRQAKNREKPNNNRNSNGFLSQLKRWSEAVSGEVSSSNQDSMNAKKALTDDCPASNSKSPRRSATSYIHAKNKVKSMVRLYDTSDLPRSIHQLQATVCEHTG